MIELKMIELINGAEALKKINEQILPMRAAFQLARIIREVQKEYDAFDLARKKLFEMYGKVEENGSYKIEKENIEDFNKEINSLLEVNVQLNVEPVMLEDLENVNITPQDILYLEKFIKE